MTTYTCKACGAPCDVQDGTVTRSCQCDDGVTAHLTAVARGAGSTAA